MNSGGLLTPQFLTAFVVGLMAFGVPVLIAGIGETINQRAGILNIGVEGTMLFGAYAGFLGAYQSGSQTIGWISAILAGLVISLLVVVLHVRMGLDVVVIGIAIVILSWGITSVLHSAQLSETYPRIGRLPVMAIPFLSDIPVLGGSLFSAHVTAYISFALVFVVSWLLRRTRLGLAVRAAGDNPEALDRSGVDVVKIRSGAALVGGSLGGLAGGYMALISSGVFVPLMTNGSGFVALMITMIAGGRLIYVLIGAMLFGTALSLVSALQLAGINIPNDLVQMLPFGFLILALFTFAGRAALPPHLGKPYTRGAR